MISLGALGALESALGVLAVGISALSMNTGCGDSMNTPALLALRLGALIALAERLGTPSRTRAALRARRALTALGALGALEIALGQDFLIRTDVRTYVRTYVSATPKAPAPRAVS